MPKTKVALTLDSALLKRVDDLVAQDRFRNRSQAIETALAEDSSEPASGPCWC
jgi:metal-responsive CopG/Arc/MetJ family transcriptional regulator